MEAVDQSKLPRALGFYRQMRFECDQCWYRRLQGRWLVIDLLFNKVECREVPRR